MRSSFTFRPWPGYNPGMRALTVLLMVFAVSAAHAAVVSGKTVYRGMGLEGASVAAYDGETAIAETKSSYHGDFRLALPPGEYRIRAGAVIPSPGGDYPVKGSAPVTVAGDRVDRVVIEMEKP